MSDEAKRYIDAVTKELVSRGLLMEAGFVSLRAIVIPKDASDAQVHEMRMAFFAGAQHLFASIMAVMDSEREPTDADLQKMSAIQEELDKFRREFELRHQPVKGQA